MATYARGNRAWGLCQRCGLRGLLNNLLFDQQYPNLRVHPECWDEKHPQERLLPVSDATSLWRPSPEDYPIVAPVLAVEQAGSDVQVVWTMATSTVLRINSYQLFRKVNDGEYALLETLPVTYDDFAAIVSQTLEYLDDTGYETDDVVTYYVEAVAGEFSARSNEAAVTIVATLPILTAALGAGGYAIGFNDDYGSITSDVFGPYTLRVLQDIYEGAFAFDGFQFYLQGASLPPADAFTSVTVNGATFNAADAFDTGDGGSNIRYWVWQVQAGLEESQDYEIEFEL